MPAARTRIPRPNCRHGTPDGTHPHESNALDRLLRSLEALDRSDDEESSGRISVLKSLLTNRRLQALLKVHECLSCKNTEARHCSTNSYRIAAEAYEELRHRRISDELEELIDLLLDPHVKALFEIHDSIATKDYLPTLPDLPVEVDEDETSIKIVRLVKNNEPLGATIRLNETSGAIYIARVMSGGAADRSGLIHVGDEVWEVNGIDIRGREPDDVVAILSSVEGAITFKLVPGDLTNRGFRESKVRVKAHFTFDPMNDPIIPCKEAGLSFRKGEILQIVSQSEPDWWQARREGEKNLRAGLIPGKLLQERRDVARRNSKHSVTDKIQPKAKGQRSPSRLSPASITKKNKKTKKIMYQVDKNEEFDGEEVVTYEEVERFYPQSKIFRPIVLIGAPGVGRNELKQGLLASDPGHFESTVPHTSRLPKPLEVNGKDYHFVTRGDMEQLISNNVFIEYGDYKGNMYGTSILHIRDVVNAGRVCVLTPHPQTLKRLRTPEMKPYVIFIKSPTVDVLKNTRMNCHTPQSYDDSGRRAFTDEECHTLVKQSGDIEDAYGHYLDATIINDDLSIALNLLCTLVSRIEHEPQWVPASWVR